MKLKRLQTYISWYKVFSMVEITLLFEIFSFGESQKSGEVSGGSACAAWLHWDWVILHIGSHAPS